MTARVMFHDALPILSEVYDFNWCYASSIRGPSAWTIVPIVYLVRPVLPRSQTDWTAGNTAFISETIQEGFGRIKLFGFNWYRQNKR